MSALSQLGNALPSDAARPVLAHSALSGARWLTAAEWADWLDRWGSFAAAFDHIDSTLRSRPNNSTVGAAGVWVDTGTLVQFSVADYKAWEPASAAVRTQRWARANDVFGVEPDREADLMTSDARVLAAFLTSDQPNEAARADGKTLSLEAPPGNFRQLRAAGTLFAELSYPQMRSRRRLLVTEAALTELPEAVRARLAAAANDAGMWPEVVADAGEFTPRHVWA